MDGVDTKEEKKWRHAIEHCFEGLDLEDRCYIPPIYVYNTLIQAISDTYDPAHPFCDKLLDQFAKSHVWAFAFIQDEHLRNPKYSEEEIHRICLCSNRILPTRGLSPETIIYHEMSHFLTFFRDNIPLDSTNEDYVEARCNAMSLQLFGKMLNKFPNYKPLKKGKTIDDFNKTIKQFVDTFDLDELMEVLNGTN